MQNFLVIRDLFILTNIVVILIARNLIKFTVQTSDEVILQLVFSKCIPVLLYGLESMSLTRSDEKSLDFTFNRFMMKLFGTTDINVIKDCQAYFGTQPPSEILTKRRCKFLEQYLNSSNCLCRYFCG